LIVITIDDRVHLLGAAAADKQRSFCAEDHLARVGHAGRLEIDGETGEQLDLVEG
jgi:hypothetical protein